jgi:hypothetical protein
MDADALTRLIMARVPEISEAEIGDVTSRLEGMVVPIKVFDHVLEVLAAFEERLAQLERRMDATPRDNRLRFGSGVSADADVGDGARAIRVERK